MDWKHILRAGGILAGFGILGTGLVAYTHQQTRDQVAANEKRALLRNLAQVVAAERVDNDLYGSSQLVQDPRLGSRKPVRVYLGTHGGKPVAAIFESIAPDGYSGQIRLLVGVNHDGSVSAVRVVAHKETPGLGDWIEIAKSEWIRSFDGKSLDAPPTERWKVRKDGGVFDQFTGATITPRAVVKAVRNTLEYFRENRDRLFTPAAEGQGHG